MPPRDSLYPGSLLNTNDSDEIINKILFRSWMEGDQPYSIDVIYRHTKGFSAFIYNEDKKPVWKSAARRSGPEAQTYAEGFAALHRWLGKRKVDGMTDPAVQIAYGIG